MKTQRFFIVSFSYPVDSDRPMRGRFFVSVGSRDAAVQAALSVLAVIPDSLLTKEVSMKTYYSELRG